MTFTRHNLICVNIFNCMCNGVLGILCILLCTNFLVSCLCMLKYDYVSKVCLHVPNSQFTLVSHFRASCFKWRETVKCKSSVNWNFAF